MSGRKKKNKRHTNDTAKENDRKSNPTETVGFRKKTLISPVLQLTSMGFRICGEKAWLMRKKVYVYVVQLRVLNKDVIDKATDEAYGETKIGQERRKFTDDEK